MKPKSLSPKKTDEEARKELQNPDMAAFDRAMKALAKMRTLPRKKLKSHPKSDRT